LNALELTQKMVRRCLQLKPSDSLPADTPLLGGFAEFNSLTITTLVVDIEAELDCEIADDELSGEIFATVGTLADFVAIKMESL